MSPFGFPDAVERARRAAEARLRALEWPADLLTALRRLQESGARAHLVGGPVRDLLLGRPLDKAWDVATSLTPAQVRERFARIEGVGEEHGTVLIVEHGLLIECTTFRLEGDYTDARRPDHVSFTDDPVQDLARRDLTVNAMAFDPVHGVFLDPFGGARDLERRVLRAVGDPIDRLTEDALRALRVARFAAVLEMEVEPETRSAMAHVVERACSLAIERVRVELDKMMAAPRPSVGLELLREAGLMALWLPEVEAGFRVGQNRHHKYDVYHHSLYACDAAPFDKRLVRWAALLHDIGKPSTRVAKEDGQGTFYNHERVGAEMADALLQRLRFSNHDREHVVHLVREHMFDYRGTWSDAAVRRFIRRAGPDSLADLFDLRMADSIGNGLKSPDTELLAAFAHRIEGILARDEAFSVGDLAIGGGEVMAALGLEPGPAVGEVLEALLEAVIEDPARNTPEGLRTLLQGLRDRSGRA